MRMGATALLAIVALLLVAQSEASLSEIDIGRHDRFKLYYSSAGVDFEDAKRFCRSGSGWLATDTNTADHEVIMSFQGRNSTAWLGGSDSAEEGKWRWVTGPESKQDNGRGRLFYDDARSWCAPTTNCSWQSGGPQNLGFGAGGSSNKMVITPSGEWRDVDEAETGTTTIGMQFYVFCEFSPSLQLVTGTTPGYKILKHTGGVTWLEASAICASEYGHLATDATAASRAFFRGLSVGTIRFWIGGADVSYTGKSLGVWEWMEGDVQGQPIYETAGSICRVSGGCRWDDPPTPLTSTANQYLQYSSTSTVLTMFAENAAAKPQNFACYMPPQWQPGYAPPVPVTKSPSMPTNETTATSTAPVRRVDPVATNSQTDSLPENYTTPTVAIPTVSNTVPVNATPAPKKSVQEWKETAPACVDGSHPLQVLMVVRGVNQSDIDVTHPTTEAGAAVSTIRVTKEDLETLTIVIQVAVVSCHTVYSSLKISQSPDSEASFASSLANSLSSESSGVQQAVFARGRSIKVSIGPLKGYNPSGDDGLRLSMGLDLVTPLPRKVDGAKWNGHVATNAHRFEAQQQQCVACLPLGGLDIDLRVSAPLRPKQNPTTKDVVSTGSVAVTGGTLFTGSTGMAGAVQRQTLLSNVAECPSTFDGEKLDMELSPTGLLFGDGVIFRPHKGAILGNTLVILGVELFHGLLVFVYKCKYGSTYLHAVSMVRFPMKTFAVVCVLMQGCLMASLVLVIYSPDGYEIVAGTFGIFTTVAIVTSIALLFRKQYFDARYSDKDLSARTSMQLLTMNRGRWVHRKEGAEEYVRIMGALFEDMRPTTYAFFLVDLVTLLATGFILALQPRTAAECRTVFLSAVVLLVGYAIFVILMRPFLSIVINVSFASIAVCQACSAVCMYIAYNNNSQTAMDLSDVANMAAMGIQVVMTVASLIKAGQDWYQDELQPDKSMKQVANDRAEVERIKKVRLLFGVGHDVVPSVLFDGPESLRLLDREGGMAATEVAPDPIPVEGEEQYSPAPSSYEDEPLAPPFETTTATQQF